MFGRRGNSGTLTILLVVSAFLNVYLMMGPSGGSSKDAALQLCQRKLLSLESESRKSKDGIGAADEWAAVSTDPAAGSGYAEPQGHHDDADSDPKSTFNGEIGWVYGLERVASRTDNTVYDPKDDEALAEKGGSRYAKSPVPKGSWKVRVAKDKWITMDEVAFAYDVWFEENQVFQYTSWLGVFVQQDPSDAFAIQDMLWRVKPDLIVEVGTNTGGGAIFYATIMKAYNPNGKIVTLDVVPQPRNWNVKNAHRCVGCIVATEHPWWNDGMITYIQGRVTDKETRDKVDGFVRDAKKVLVIEDASHRYPDTLQNIESIYQWVSVDSYLLVQDTKMDRFVAQLGKKYGRLKFGPMRSVDEFLRKHPNFVVDRRFEYLLYSQHHRGYLKRRY